ncbi:hypothetical protein H5410_053685 [Solanum commersonii]|uniref:Uncharacterized protein n=1 Tax=Solanum commersonii TaxID=4109 RepID=A0A9J5X577_SOLCO|nr:hypothetical protein H5410_053685 [Solanum commersonii]
MFVDDGVVEVLNLEEGGAFNENVDDNLEANVLISNGAFNVRSAEDILRLFRGNVDDNHDAKILISSVRLLVFVMNNTVKDYEANSKFAMPDEYCLIVMHVTGVTSRCKSRFSSGSNWWETRRTPFLKTIDQLQCSILGDNGSAPCPSPLKYQAEFARLGVRTCELSHKSLNLCHLN